MQELVMRNIYGPELADKIQWQGTIMISVANRWTMGWPTRVAAMVATRTYWASLAAQTELELDVLADARHLQHLSHREILQRSEIRESPPC